MQVRIDKELRDLLLEIAEPGTIVDDGGEKAYFYIDDLERFFESLVLANPMRPRKIKGVTND